MLLPLPINQPYYYEKAFNVYGNGTRKYTTTKENYTYTPNIYLSKL